MYLSKLEIFGFKSFAQKTEIKFNQGVTAIVGPNGCGKTNIVDAIRWGLGEQKSNTLRSDKMENVIFNGTSNRKPMGMSEVSLTIENTKGILPTEYTDVTITRRIFRSGESEYLLNKNLCRLKDITNLFMDTGIGANAYSVIELKMVETILSNKADERRAMFEEAAGVKKYKHRRRLALRKLDEVKNDLTRVNDIVSEVGKKVASLERQAKKADRYNNLTGKLRESEIELAERELVLFNEQVKEIKISKDENLNKKIEVENEVKKISEKLTELKNSLNDFDLKLNNKRAEISEQTEKIYNIQNAMSVSNERKKSLQINIEFYNNELNELKERLENSHNIIKQSQENIERISGEIKNTEDEREKLTGKVNTIKDELEQRRAGLRDKSDLVIEKLKIITNKENELSNLQNSLNDKNNSINKLNEKIQNLTNDVAKTVGYVEELNNEKQSATKKLEESEAYYTRMQKEKDEWENRLAALKSDELQLKGVLNGLRDKIIFVQNLVENLEGFSKGAKALIENRNWSSAETTLLADAGSSKPNFRIAIEAALKNNLNNILIDSLDDLKKGINYLKNNEIGKASFYLLNNGGKNSKGFLDGIKNWLSRRKLKNVKSENGVTGMVIDFVEANSKWIPYFEKLLVNCVLVENLDIAFKLFKKYSQFSFATLDGDYISSEGLVEAGSVPRIDDSIFGRKQLLEELKKKVPVKEKKLQNVESKIREAEEKINSIDLKVLSEQGKMLVNDLVNVDKQIAQFEFEKKKADDEIENIHKEIHTLASDANEIDNLRIEADDELNSLKSIKANLDEEFKALENSFAENENQFSAVKNELSNKNLQLERLHGEKRNLLNNIEQTETNIEIIKDTITRRTNETKIAGKEIETLNNESDEKSLNLVSMNELKAELENSKSEMETRYNELREQITSLETNQNELRVQRDSISDELHAADIKLNELKLKTENLKEHISENYSLSLELKEFEDNEAFNFHERKEEVLSLKQRIKNLGPINLLAYSEFEEEKQRLEFLTKQRDDLLESEKDIVQTIQEINNTAQDQFTDTFEKIRVNFSRIFQNLFDPGDEADLKLEENIDPLEAKIEITAKPKGKRPTSIELLSGGEKTLTAIALLFAIYLVKPSPFCILDEIDAPLDDSNIDRFGKLLQDFSNETQFIVVTHNKKTMEAAQTMYGVTMQDEGVSKLVSVMFNEDFDFAAQV